MFRRRKRDQEPGPQAEQEFVDDLDEQDRAYEDALLTAELEAAEADAARRVPERPQGPWDEADAPDDELPRLDLGGLRVPVPPGTEVRVEVGGDGQIAGVTLLQPTGQVQVSAFAAPRTEGIWDEVRAEIAESVSGGGGSVEEAEGPYGTELRAGVPTEVPGQGIALAAARFVGVDGPRWFLRALYTGQAAVDEQAAAGLAEAVRGVVVVRGGDPMAVRDPLPLRLPPEAAAQAAQAQAEQARAEAQQGELPAMPERGPEITETR